MSSPPPFLSLEQVGKTYPAPTPGGLQVLKNICLEIHPRETIAIVGPSGSGKSTLLNIIGTLDTPTSGKVRLDGLNLHLLSRQDQAKVRNDKIGMIFQMHHLLKQCNVLENVLVPTLVSRNAAGTEARARYLLEMVGLTQRLDHRPDQLSVGEQLRVAVARAMINRPRLLLADEPTGSLDHTGAGHLTELLLKMNKIEDLTLIVVTHSQALARRMDKIYELIDGRLMAQQP